MRAFAKRAVRLALVPLIYRYPPSGLGPERLQFFLGNLIETAEVPGAVVEIGCNLGGTGIYAATMLRRLKIAKRYICIDTFDGFVDSQFEADARIGTPPSWRNMFSGSSKALVRKIVDYHGCQAIELIKKDCTELTEADIGGAISTCLLDVDLSEPTRRSLEIIWPMLSPGGTVIVDDCEGGKWKARLGVDAFSSDAGLTPEYAFGLGIFRKPP